MAAYFGEAHSVAMRDGAYVFLRLFWTVSRGPTRNCRCTSSYDSIRAPICVGTVVGVGFVVFCVIPPESSISSELKVSRPDNGIHHPQLSTFLA